MTPLTFLALNGTLTLEPTKKDFFKFSGIKYVKVKIAKDITSDVKLYVIKG